MSVSVFSNQRRRVGAAFSGPGRCIVESKGGAGCLFKKKKRLLESNSLVVRGQEEAYQASEWINYFISFPHPVFLLLVNVRPVL